MSEECVSTEELRTRLAKVVKEQGSQLAAAAYFGVNPSYISAILLGKSRLGTSIPRTLGYEAVTVYRKIEEHP